MTSYSDVRLIETNAELHRARLRIAELERLIVAFATADEDWFRVSGDVTSHRAQRLHAAEVALRDEGAKIQAPEHTHQNV